MLLDGLFNILTAANHTRCGSTQLNKVLSDLLAVEHGVEGCDFVDAGRFDLADLCHLVHGGYGKPAPVLALGEVEEGDDSGLLVVVGVFGEDLFDATVVFFGEVKVLRCCVV